MPSVSSAAVPRQFHLDEDGYIAWLGGHPDGFVFNHFGGRNAADNIVHRASCVFLHRPQDEGVRTHVRKVCADDLEAVEDAATELRGGDGGWKHCGACLSD